MQTLRGAPGRNRALRLPTAIAGFMLAGCLCADIDNDFDGDIDLDQDD